MNRDEARKAAEVMIAYAKGKQIQLKALDYKDYWSDIASDQCLEFNWSKYEYRVKPEQKIVPKLVPFTFKDRKLFMGKAVIHKDPIVMYCSLILTCDVKSVGLKEGECDYKRLLEEYEFEDRSSCGKIVEE